MWEDVEYKKEVKTYMAIDNKGGDSFSTAELAALQRIALTSPEILDRRQRNNEARRRLFFGRYWARTRRSDAKSQRQPYGPGLPPAIPL